VPEDRKRNAGKSLSMWYDRIEEVGKLALKSFQDDVKLSEETKSIRMEKYKEPSGEWEKQAASLVPSRTIFGPLTLDGIPPEQWVEVNSSPRWWSAGNWPVMAWYWVDGKRSLLDIRDYLELEAGRPVRNFDLVKYFRFLESHGLVTFNR